MVEATIEPGGGASPIARANARCTRMAHTSGVTTRPDNNEHRHSVLVAGTERLDPNERALAGAPKESAVVRDEFGEPPEELPGNHLTNSQLVSGAGHDRNEGSHLLG